MSGLCHCAGPPWIRSASLMPYLPLRTDKRLWLIAAARTGGSLTTLCLSSNSGCKITKCNNSINYRLYLNEFDFISVSYKTLYWPSPAFDAVHNVHGCVHYQVADIDKANHAGMPVGFHWNLHKLQGGLSGLQTAPCCLCFLKCLLSKSFWVPWDQ